ncbi:MAG: hypothetical protein ABIG34_04830 [Candidatus Peregrinibacteria bacterium]
MASITRKRMGMFWWYQVKCYMKCFFCETQQKEAMRKRGWRIRIAKKLIVGFKRRNIREYLFKTNLMDIFMYANEAKSKFIQGKEGRRIIPEEIIPLEVCAIAQIAHRTGIPILSFNSDYHFFCHLPLSPDTYLTYLFPENYLIHHVLPR